jgi:NAD(P)-dependent dehydrogenase (short-subunit alcohol dehydrogenase family)
VLKVFITGASSGIGWALAEHYAAQGAQLGLSARRADLLQRLSASWPGQVICYPLDVTDAAALRAAGDRLHARLGAPDIVIANAGVSVGTLSECADDLEAIRRVMDVNFFGMAATFSPFIAAMRQAGGGRLVGIASLAGIRGLPGAEAYSASKAAAISYLESLRLELRASGIKVVTLCPWLHPDADDRGEPFPDAFPDAGRCGCAAFCAGHRARQQLQPSSLADGTRRQTVAPAAQQPLRSAVCRRAAQAAASITAVRFRGRPGPGCLWPRR